MLPCMRRKRSGGWGSSNRSTWTPSRGPVLVTEVETVTTPPLAEAETVPKLNEV